MPIRKIIAQLEKDLELSQKSSDLFYKLLIEEREKGERKE
tara:strand:+ start:380 stop:499 length:120 start_codon:yes stop_codon:yes gene_type:complete